MFSKKKLNSIKVKPVITVDEGIKNIKGYKLFPFKNWITYISSRKKSGKTCLINTIINKTTSKKTVIWLFCSTHKIDPTWKQIISDLESRGYIVNAFSSIEEGSKGKKINNLDIILDDLGGKEEKPITEPKPIEFVDRFGIKSQIPLTKQFINNPYGKEEKKPQNKVAVADNLFILDDIANELKNPALGRLTKTHRHYNANVIISSQYAHDLLPQCISQCDVLIAFKGNTVEKMEHLHKVLDLSLPFDNFWNAYNQCCSEPFNFCYLNIREEKIRHNFDTELEGIS